MSLPSLGSRGQGWVALQVVLFVALLASALAGGAWSNGVPGLAAGGALIALGAALLAAGGRRLGTALTPYPAPRPGDGLRTTGVYARARHPMYGGGILFAFGWAVVFASVAGLAVALVLVVFLDLKSRREEAWLVERRAGYAEYRERTPRRLIPFVY
jgi:protein-S-isoprenylcysteine O-methyltransferase Ste14